MRLPGGMRGSRHEKDSHRAAGKALPLYLGGEVAGGHGEAGRSGTER